MLKALSTLIKIGIASLITGALLTKLDLSAEQILLELGMTPENVMLQLEQGFKWAMPNIILGSMVIVPVWLVVYLFRPPRG
ncbi:MAG: DUF6460 domain-containing protein [Rhizobiaceae bacterium]